VHAIDERGNDISRKISVKYAKPEPQPGFEALFILAAVAVGMALLRRLRA
jgi:hypothetical protein